MRKFLPLLFLLCSALRLSAVNPVPYTEAVSFSCLVSGSGEGTVTVYDESASVPWAKAVGHDTTVESDIKTAWLRPGKSYSVSFGASGPWGYSLSFITPDGYQLYVDDMQYGDTEI